MDSLFFGLKVWFGFITGIIGVIHTMLYLARKEKEHNDRSNKRDV